MIIFKKNSTNKFLRQINYIAVAKTGGSGILFSNLPECIVCEKQAERGFGLLAQGSR